MQQHIHTIVKHFFQKDTLQEVPEQVLQQFTEDHPYSSVGHWLLAKKVHDTAPERATAQSASAATWFNNPLWLHWTLQEHEPVAETLLIPSLPKEEPVTARTIVAPEPQQPEAETSADLPQPAAVETVAPIVEETPAPQEVAAATPVAEETEPLETEIFIPGVAEPVSLIEETPAPAAVAESPIEAVAPEVPETPAETPAPVAETPQIPAIPKTGLLDNFKPVISESEEPVFEPYHTIDYFASQGIKLRQEDLKDKLGKQLKSFTEWLRSMKRIAPTQSEEILPNPFDENMQQSIQEIAGHSVEGKDVVTEAMAEVWVKQGSKQKAIAIYEKLSLLNPAKSPYFAARIEQIKAL
jgi:hypothetical protein